eukprot:gnl/TRDRNA2_/TRDRNA2_81026_c0_seq1.p2 gnl/TRDRNA2_/TRDRNA2_81026_c0~~gnl/TRDRNA2_/TRDRNA2_81026_c0_seq1.p2  ORF type:complete len:177 (-),score=45.65 gnl/TRDRNA2_/TRDRNA2_81026_c0_seq1:222-752(-)
MCIAPPMRTTAVLFATHLALSVQAGFLKQHHDGHVIHHHDHVNFALSLERLAQDADEHRSNDQHKIVGETDKDGNVDEKDTTAAVDADGDDDVAEDVGTEKKVHVSTADELVDELDGGGDYDEDDINKNGADDGDIDTDDDPAYMYEEQEKAAGHAATRKQASKGPKQASKGPNHR